MVFGRFRRRRERERRGYDPEQLCDILLDGEKNIGEKLEALYTSLPSPIRVVFHPSIAGYLMTKYKDAWARCTNALPDPRLEPLCALLLFKIIGHSEHRRALREAAEHAVMQGAAQSLAKDASQVFNPLAIRKALSVYNRLAEVCEKRLSRR